MSHFSATRATVITSLVWSTAWLFHKDCPSLLVFAKDPNAAVKPSSAAPRGLLRPWTRQRRRQHRQRSAAFLSFPDSPVSTTAGSSVGAPPPQGGDEVWYEIRPTWTQHELDPAWSLTTDKPARKRLWYGRYDEQCTWIPSATSDSTMSKSKATTSLHPLRQECWTLRVLWTGKLDKQLPSTMQVEFDTDTGYCLARSSSATQFDAAGDVVVGLGHWQMFPWGVWFTLVDASGSVEYTFTAQFHLNPFGDHAKLMQGSIVRYTLLNSGVEDVIQDDPMVRRPRPWFRPVVGSFSGQGK